MAERPLFIAIISLLEIVARILMIITGLMCEFPPPETLESLGVEVTELDEFAPIIDIFLGSYCSL